MFLKLNHVPIVLYISSKVMDGQKKIDVSALLSVINSHSVSFPLSQFIGGLVRSLTMLSARNKGSHSLHPGCLL